MMRLGLNSFAYRWAVGYRGFTPTRPLTAFDLLDKASTLGVDVLQIDDNLAWEGMDIATLLRLSDMARERGIELQLGTIGMRDDHLRAVLERAHTAGVHLIRIHEDGRHWKPAVSDLAAHVASVLPICRQFDTTFAIENHFCYGAEDVAQVIASVGDAHVAASCDTGNTIARLEGWREALDLLAPHTVSLHLKDLVAERRGVGFYVVGRPLGKGVIDMRQVIDAVRAAGRDPDVVLELWMDFATDEATTLQQEDAWVRESLDYARTLLSVHQ